MNNAIKHPEAWDFYIEQARNMMEEDWYPHNYRIPVPDMSGNFIPASTVEELWSKFIMEWYKPSHTSESIYGKIQYIVETF